MDDRNPLVLVVDDDAMNRDLLCRRLARMGYDTCAAANGPDALALVGSRDLDLVLLDVQMPDMSGLEVLLTIRQQHSSSRLPVLMVTAKTQSEDIVTALDMGADDYITKPIDFPVAFARIRGHLTRRRLEERIRVNEERYALVSTFLDGLWDWKPSTGEIYFSARWKAILGFEEDEVGGDPEEWFSRVHPSDLARLRRDLDAHLAGHTPMLESEYRIRHKSGTYRWALTRGMAVPARDGAPMRIAGSLADITQGKVVDLLTGLPNRVVLVDRLDRLLLECRNGGPGFAVFFIDVDQFKVVNDSIGHQGGDLLLQGVARRVEGALRVTDTVMRVGAPPSDDAAAEHTLGRLGGDEFIVLLRNIETPEQAMRVADRIQQGLCHPFQIGERDVFASVSIGVAVGNATYATAEEVMRDADTAMYRAKSLGLGRCELFDVAMREQALRRHQLDMAVRRAAERHEFMPYYQPIIDMRSGRLAGFEALLRWRHPDRGVIGPAEFMPLIEQNGLLPLIGRRLLQDVAQHQRLWHARYPEADRLWVNVNFSSQQFLEAGLIERLIESLDSAGLAPHNLVVEITERTAIGNFALTASLLEQLRQVGIRVVLDDFGTGYSSLACLHQLPISGLKLDPTFIQGDGRRPAVLNAVISIADSLGLTLTAEGIETEPQCERLRRLGCDYAQGFLFARPLDVEAAEAEIRRGRQWLPVDPAVDAVSVAPVPQWQLATTNAPV